MNKAERRNLFQFIRCLIVVCAGCTVLAPVAAQQPVPADTQKAPATGRYAVSLAYTGSGGYTLVERTNLRRYVNGKYIGLTSREIRSFVSLSDKPSNLSKKQADSFGPGQWYDGNFYVMEETMHNASSAAAGIHDSIPSEFHISPEGKLVMVTDNGYPSFRSFPAFPDKKISIGDSWQAEAERAVDPLTKGIATRIPMTVLYTLADEEMYRGVPVYRIKALWQTNYNDRVRDPRGDGSLLKAAGSHKADILIRKATGDAILVIDAVDEQFMYSDGSAIQFKGTMSLFTEFPPAIEHEKIIQSLNRIADTTGVVNPDTTTSIVNPNTGAAGDVSPNTATGGVSPNTGTTWVASPDKAAGGVNPNTGAVTAGAENNMIVEKTPAGLRLSVRDIKFAPDSADVMPEEKTRLDEIADVLKLAPKSQFLVEGHTASVGRPEGEQKLSELRAHRIAEELAKRGVSSSAFICRGWGGNRPVASNDTDEGKAQNRRVEITILE